MRKTRKNSKYENDALIVESTVKRIEIKNELINDKYKTVFYFEGNAEEKMCVYWGRTVLEEGDRIKMKGRFLNEVFLAWSLQIHASGTAN